MSYLPKRSWSQLRPLATVLLLLFCGIGMHAQTNVAAMQNLPANITGPWIFTNPPAFPPTTVGELPMPAATQINAAVIVTDGSGATPCAMGGGSIQTWCRNTGSAWIAVGGTGSSTGAGTLYSSGHPYNAGDSATYGGNLYVSLIDSNSGNEPDISPADWRTNLAPNLVTTSDGKNTYLNQYVASWGNDNNDGLSWGTAKVTWDAACEQLYGGGVGGGAHYCGVGGTIYITDSGPAGPGIWACSNHAYGIQLVGNEGDPNAPYNGTCWENTQGPIETIGVGCESSSTDSGTPVCLIKGGGSGDLFHPGLWESANSFSTTWRNIQFIGQGRNIVLGVCTDHTEPLGGNCGVANNNFYAISTYPAQSTTTGPGWYLATNSLWIRVEDFSISGNSSATSLNSDSAAAVQIGSTGGNGSGAINFDHGVLQNGGFRVHGGAASSIEVQNLETTEGAYEAAFQTVDGNGVYNLLNFEPPSDPSGGPGYSVLNGAGTVYATGVMGVTIGPILKMGTGVGTVTNPTPPSIIANTFGSTSPTTWRAQTNDAAHQFPAIIVPGTTLFPTNINSITVCGTCTLTTGIVDPSGGTQAVQISDSNAGGDTITIPATGDGGLVVNDSYIIGFWARPSVAGNLAGSPFNFFLSGAGDTCSQSADQFVGLPFITSSNSWQHYIAICTVTAYASAGAPNLSIVVSSTQTVQIAFLELILQHGVSADDVAEKALHFGSWNSSCSAGQLCTVNGPIAPTGTATLTGTGACLTADLMSQLGGAWSGSVECTNTTGASTLIITPGTAATNGWNCKASYDSTTQTDTFTYTYSTTSCTLTGTVAANDVIVFTANPF